MKKFLVTILVVVGVMSGSAQSGKLKVIDMKNAFTQECICYKSINNVKSDMLNIDKTTINYIKLDTTINSGILNISLSINNSENYIFNQVSMQKLQSNNSLIYYSDDENLDKLNTRIYIKIYKDILLRDKFQITIEENCNSNSKWVSEVDCFIQNIESYQQKESYQTKEKQTTQNDMFIQTYKNQNFTHTNTPGELIAYSARLQNQALTIGLISSIIGGVMIGCSPLLGSKTYRNDWGMVYHTRNNSLALIIPGSIICGVGCITSITLVAHSNKILKEAGLKMTQIQIKTNGVQVNF